MGGGLKAQDAQSDFTYLDTDSDSEMSVDDRVSFKRDFRRKDKLIEDIKDLCGETGRSKRPLHVAIIGSYGVGKSSFVNTVGAALARDRWREYAYSGQHGGEAKPISVFVSTFPKCCKEEEDEFKTVNLPTLIDIAGFPDEDNEKWEELLRILFYGRLLEGESITSAHEYSEKYGLEGLRQKYSAHDEKLKVDRVIFAGAADQPAPTNLMSCVMRAARPSGSDKDRGCRTIPVFGVLTKIDKVDVEGGSETASTSENEFLSKLGLHGAKHRFLRCRNYCDDVDSGKRQDTVLPEIDVPVLRFLRQVFDPVQRVQLADESFNATVTTVGPEGQVVTPATVATHQRPATRGPHQPEPDQNSVFIATMVVIAIEAIMVAILLHWFLSPSFDAMELSATCSRFRAERHRLPDFPAFCKICDKDGQTLFRPLLVPFLCFIIVRIGSVLLLRRLPEILRELHLA